MVNPDGTEKWLFSDDADVTSVAAIGQDGTIHFSGKVCDPERYGNLGKLFTLDMVKNNMGICYKKIRDSYFSSY